MLYILKIHNSTLTLNTFMLDYNFVLLISVIMGNRLMLSSPNALPRIRRNHQYVSSKCSIYYFSKFLFSSLKLFLINLKYKSRSRQSYRFEEVTAVGTVVNLKVIAAHSYETLRYSAVFILKKKT